MTRKQRKRKAKWWRHNRKEYLRRIREGRELWLEAFQMVYGNVHTGDSQKEAA